MNILPTPYTIRPNETNNISVRTAITWEKQDQQCKYQRDYSRYRTYCPKTLGDLVVTYKGD